ncbi:type II toxin-antitoxin system RelE/ParE family toxin [Leptospirillum ferriphilum]|uniref:type II toxin-antitoxin system RelE/ParE family toxin n=1 Tax=Leptospirillum ferriphilum TaxID=178606 RepID=UPI0006B1D8B6|nr:type II toxin-antitoxin system RelE/ParE family toxin [Leptospirillum ferriphilum]
MILLRQTETFSRWLSSLKDRQGQARILSRLDRIAMDNFGDAKSVGEGISEIRIDSGPGYRLYFVRRENAVILLLCGGDKSTQDRDISRAKELAQNLET